MNTIYLNMNNRDCVTGIRTDGHNDDTIKLF